MSNENRKKLKDIDSKHKYERNLFISENYDVLLEPYIKDFKTNFNLDFDCITSWIYRVKDKNPSEITTDITIILSDSNNHSKLFSIKLESCNKEQIKSIHNLLQIFRRSFEYTVKK